MFSKRNSYISWLLCRKARGKGWAASLMKAGIAELVYHIWTARNVVLFQNRRIDIHELEAQLIVCILRRNTLYPRLKVKVDKLVWG